MSVHYLLKDKGKTVQKISYQSLCAGIESVYKDYLDLITKYFEGSKENKDEELYREGRTVLFGIAALLHREGLERAFLSAAEGGIDFSKADSETKYKAMKLNEMRFLDYRDGKFVVRKLPPKEFCDWFSGIGSHYSRKYKMEGRPSPLLDKAINILNRAAVEKLVNDAY
jgi:hypothetical protein